MNKELCGGPLTGDLQTVTVPKLKTPLVELIDSTKTFGLHEIFRLRESNRSHLRNKYYDIIVLNSNESHVEKLKRMASTPQIIKCCLDKGFSEVFNGFVRAISYDMETYSEFGVLDEDGKATKGSYLWFKGFNEDQKP